MKNNMTDMAGGRASIQIERPSLQVFSQADIDAGRTGEPANGQGKEVDNGQE